MAKKKPKVKSTPPAEEAKPAKKSSSSVAKPKRKELRKQKFLEKLKPAIAKKAASSAEKKKSAKKAGTAALKDLGAELGDTLPSLEALLDQRKAAMTVKPSARPMSDKTKKRVEQAELAKFKNVLAHSAFKANPFQAIGEHLRNTVSSVTSMSD